MIAFLKTIIYIPLYNFLIVILNIPYVDVGVAVIILTVIVKIILYPISKKATAMQFKMNEVGKELSEIKEKYKDKETQALKTMEFYKKHKINPFGSILSIIIQIPIIYSLYHMFLYSGLPTVNQVFLYDFIKIPEISMRLFGLFDISQKSLILALFAGISTFLQTHLSAPSNALNKEKNDLSQMMAKQMKFTLPFIVFFISWKISGVIALYWFVGNIVSILQDRLIKRSIGNSKHVEEPVALVPKN